MVARSASAPSAGVGAPAARGPTGRRRVVAPGIAPAVIPARGLFPLSLGRQALALPEAVVTGAEPGHLHRGVVLEHGVRPEYLSAAAAPRVLVVPVEGVLTLGALEPLGVQKGREFAVGHLVAVDVELAEGEPVLGRLAGRGPGAPPG